MNSSRWPLRVFHEGGASLRLERPGRWIWFDPAALPAGGLALVSWHDLDRAAGARDAASRGERPEVVASRPTLDWLGGRGEIVGSDPTAGPVEIDGVQIEAIPYTPIPWATPREAARKVRGALLHPLRAAGRLSRRLDLPSGPPLVYHLTFADGTRLLHLNCALHTRTDPSWASDLQARWGGADWIVAGVDYREDDGVARWLPGFGGRCVLLTDLVNRVRAEIGLPTGLLTPTVDRLIEAGVPAYPLAGGASFRFEGAGAAR